MRSGTGALRLEGKLPGRARCERVAPSKRDLGRVDV